MRVYLSHAMTEADIAAAKALSRQFDMMGHDVVRSLDFREDLLNLQREIALQHSDLLVVVLTSAYEERGTDHPELALARQYHIPRYFLVAESIMHMPDEIMSGETKVVGFRRDERGYSQAVVNVLDYFEDPHKDHQASDVPSHTATLPKEPSTTAQRPYDGMIVFAPDDRIQAAKLERLLRKNGIVSYWQGRGMDEAQAAREEEVAFAQVPLVLAYWSKRVMAADAWHSKVSRAIQAGKRVVIVTADETPLPDALGKCSILALGDQLPAIEAALIALLR